MTKPMKNLIRNVLIIFMLTFGLFGNETIQAQYGDSTILINATGKYIGEIKSVVLRWVPSHPGIWLQSNYYGYKIERTELIDGEQPSEIKWVILADTLKPKSLDAWRDQVKITPQDTMLQVAGQTIHQPKTNGAVNELEFLKKSDELQNLYSACILATEFSRNAALFSALRFEDRDALPGKSYVYRISSLVPDSNIVNRAYAVIIVKVETPNWPKITTSRVGIGENYVEIYWDRSIYKEFYSAFNVYKSSDGKQFYKLNHVPIAPIAYKDENSFVLRDSLEKNYSKYFYKIEGLTSYATVGPMSDVITVEGRDRTPPSPPHNVQFTYIGNHMMKITWETNPEDQDIAGFRISRSNEQQKDFIEITKQPLPGNVREYIDSTCNNLINNYYWIGVFDKENNVNVTAPKYGTIIDSLPPDMPTGLKGSIDTNGIVTLHWHQNKEADLKGYIVHFSNDRQLTFYNQTDYALADTIWRDTIPLNVLTEEIYYKISALDHRSNASPFTAVVVLKKPDLVPPTSPLFQYNENTENGVLISWSNSHSHDVKENVLTRKTFGTSNAEILYKSSNEKLTDSYLDKTTKPGVKYEYQLYAIDDAGLRSNEVGSLIIIGYEVKKVDPISDLKIHVDTSNKTHLQWTHIEKQNNTFMIYRSYNNGPFVSYKSVEKNLSFNDPTKYKMNDVIKYKVQAVNSKGWRSDFSNEVVATFIQK